jgi:hypothetical protein
MGAIHPERKKTGPEGGKEELSSEDVEIDQRGWRAMLHYDEQTEAEQREKGPTPEERRGLPAHPIQKKEQRGHEEKEQEATPKIQLRFTCCSIPFQDL